MCRLVVKWKNHKHIHIPRITIVRKKKVTELIILYEAVQVYRKQINCEVDTPAIPLVTSRVIAKVEAHELGSEMMLGLKYFNR